MVSVKRWLTYSLYILAFVGLFVLLRGFLKKEDFDKILGALKNKEKDLQKQIHKKEIEAAKLQTKKEMINLQYEDLQVNTVRRIEAIEASLRVKDQELEIYFKSVRNGALSGNFSEALVLAKAKQVDEF